MSKKLNNIVTIESKSLESENSMFSAVVKASDTVRLDAFRLSLESEEKRFMLDLSDIFLYNHIRFPSLDQNKLIYYTTDTCKDLKPFIKSVSWKNNNLIISEPDYVNMILGMLLKEIEKNSNTTYLVERNETRINICSQFFGLKYELGETNRLFFTYKNTLFYININGLPYEDGKPLLETLDTLIKTFEA